MISFGERQVVSRRLLLPALCLAIVGCKDVSHHGSSEKGGGVHPHPNETSKEPAIPSLSVTRYQSGLELFMESPAFVVGKPSALLAHFTDARDPHGFKVVTEGRVTAILRHSDGSEERFVAEKFAQAGVSKPIVIPKQAGSPTLTLRLEGAGVGGAIEVGQVKVHPTVEAAMAAGESADAAGEGTVPFFKEQQWKTQYATAPAMVRELQASVRANGEIKPVAGQAADLATPMAGLIPVGAPVPHLGQAVKKGVLLLRLSPTNLVS
ncbi:MAG TPA: hypothetical protein VGG33_23570, partial [Polyangia bacterium]